ncbi:hypothetical protein PSH70_24915 [Pseudomonas fluorescens]|uniref:hypothetical protein n=1 Tax=Pseudomonas TaxID=286 RepID=UPI001C0B1383|nr:MULTISPECIES: hypothetical protein [Pseudomonas]WLH29435.1 hypothetical protein PSH56_25910 [Pseudomonas canadensis]WLH73160.1 hypothetical protein PSH70_24915 [Pseudomonas fluorescens]WLH84156.1 hypothetical protein PSH96_25675 [Pseudomonas sp. FP2338]
MSLQDKNPQSGVNKKGNNTGGISPAMVGWGVAAAVLAIVSVTFNSSPMALGAGWFSKCLAVMVGAFLGWLGALAGDAIRKFAHPDAVLTNGGILSLIWIKVFWAVGPQVLGLCVGVFFGGAMVLR